MMSYYPLLLVSLLFSPLTQSANAGMQNSIASTVLGLFAIIALSFFLVWALKKMRLSQVLGVNSKLKIVSQLAVGQRERIAIIDVNGEQILIGITPTQINLLKSIEKPISLPEAEIKTKTTPKDFFSFLPEQNLKK